MQMMTPLLFAYEDCASRARAHVGQSSLNGALRLRRPNVPGFLGVCIDREKHRFCFENRFGILGKRSPEITGSTTLVRLL